MRAGSYPICVGQEYPIDGLGKAYACQRGGICSACLSQKNGPFPWSIYPGKSREGTSYWFCTACTLSQETITHFDAWGKSVKESNLLLTPGCVHPSSPPEPSRTSRLQPYETLMQLEAAKREAAKGIVGSLSSRHLGGEDALQDCFMFLRTLRPHNFSRSQQQDVLDLIHELMARGSRRFSDQSGIDASTSIIAQHSYSLLPKTLAAVEKWAAPFMETPVDVFSRSVKFSLHRLGQLDACCTVYIRSADSPYIYVNSQMETLIGPAFHQGSSRFQQLQKEACGSGSATLLFLVLHLNKTDSRNGSREPFRITKGNLTSTDRWADHGICLSGLEPVIRVHRTRGNEHIDYLNSAQRAAKRTVEAAYLAHALIDLEVVAREVMTFKLFTPEAATGRLLDVKVRSTRWKFHRRLPFTFSRTMAL